VKIFPSLLGKSTLPNPVKIEVRNLREVMQKGAEKEIVPLQQITQREVRRALLQVGKTHSGIPIRSVSRAGELPPIGPKFLKFASRRRRRCWNSPASPPSLP